ncbi:MAG: GDYXXLXY domain-containing protein [Candidatus Obscuribacterales bacterium]|nr:GDYXXLXY domain-containing protein [Candidatus Obscuribacterales bacterium]
MNECLTFCILAEPGLQTFTPMYFTLLLLIAATLVASTLLTSNGVIAGRHSIQFSPVEILSNRKTQVCLVLILQLLVLASFEGKYSQVVKVGRTIKLEANPADPFDFFRGNYQVLNFPQARLSDSIVRFHSLNSTCKNSTVYVVFQADGELWKATDVYPTKPAWSAQSVVMKGRVDNCWSGNLVLHYGIEQYFFPEGKQVDMAKGASATVQVDDDGDAVLTSLLALGKPASH